MTTTKTQGLTVERRFTLAGRDPFESFNFVLRQSKIVNPDGTVVFQMDHVEVPDFWDQVSVDILASKYFRKAGVPQTDLSGQMSFDDEGSPVLGPERSIKQVALRMANAWRLWGQKGGYFATEADAEAFRDEMAYMLVAQMAAPNSPAWFNVGLHEAYGIVQDPDGSFYFDPETRTVKQSAHRYERAAVNACFPAGHRVLTASGSLDIEKVEPGELVLTHEGRFRRVLNIMQHQVNEDVVELSISRYRARGIMATTEHPFYSISAADAYKMRRGTHSPVPSWVTAGELQPGDFLAVAREKFEGVIPGPVDLSLHIRNPHYFEVSDDTITSTQGASDGTRRTMRRFVEFDDPTIMYLFGRWLGDGSLDRQRTGSQNLSHVRFTFGSHETEDIEKVSDLMYEHFGVTCIPEYASGQNTAHLRYGRSALAEWFHDTFGEYFDGKRLPEWAYNLPVEHRVQLLLGLWESDGCDGRNGSIHFDHSNLNLAEGILRLSRSLGYRPSLSGGHVMPLGTTEHWRVTLSKSDADQLRAEQAAEELTTGHGFIEVDGQTFYRIAGVTRVPFYGTVYNLQVEEDETYCVEGIVVHNCFISSVRDQLVGEGSIFDFAEREARLFSQGSGSGANLSYIRAEGEKLSAGGTSSGVLSFMKVLDAAAGAIKSGGSTRRAAKMVILDADHPEIQAFIWSKAHEERKAAALIAAGYDGGYEGEAVRSVAFQNANHSVRITPGFMQAVRDDADWNLLARTDGSVMKTIKARQLWQEISEAAWACADPGVQFDEILNDWNTAADTERIRGTNPCSEYSHIDDSACNLASFNLVKFWDDETRTFDIETFEHGVRLWTLMLEIHVSMSHYPASIIAENSFKHRTLGLGYANLGALLMRAGLAYDSEPARAAMGAITALMHNRAYATSAEIATAVGACEAYEENRHSMGRVLRNHRRAAYGSLAQARGVPPYEQLTIEPSGIDHLALAHTPFAALTDPVLRAADDAMVGIAQDGYRNMQVTVLAPTGTIGLVMSCDTTGVEPDFALVKLKKLAGGGYMRIINSSATPALRTLGYTDSQISEILAYALGTQTLHGPTSISASSLIDAGMSKQAVDAVEKSLANMSDLTWAFAPHIVGADTFQAFGVSDHDGQSLLEAMGFSASEIESSSKTICGHLTVEGAPHLRGEHLPVFDCAVECGDGTRSIAWEGHVAALSAVAPHLSGSVSKTVNMPNQATVEDISNAYTQAYEWGVKCVAIYRDGSKVSQPLSSAKSSDGESDEIVDLLRQPEPPVGVSPAEWYRGQNPPRFRLPNMRFGPTWRLEVGGEELYVRAGEYPDGTMGELFIDWGKQGSTLRGVTSALSITISQALQHGVPIERIVKALRGHTFEPRGMVVGHDNVKMATSVVDAIIRVIGYYYTGQEDLVQVQGGPVASSAPASVKAPHVTMPAVAPADPDAGHDTASHKSEVASKPEGERIYGKSCSSCGSANLIQAGSCAVCGDCGTTTGCS